MTIIFQDLWSGKLALALSREVTYRQPTENLYFFSYTCIIKSWGERNTAVTTYFGENEFFTKMNAIFNVTDSDKFLKLLFK